MIDCLFVCLFVCLLFFLFFVCHWFVRLLVGFLVCCLVGLCFLMFVYVGLSIYSVGGYFVGYGRLWVG